MKKQKVQILAVLLGLQLSYISNFTIITGLARGFQQDLGLDSQGFAVLMALYAIAAGLASVLAAFVIDQADRKKLLLWNLSLFSLATWGCAFSTDSAMLLAFRALAGGSGGILSAQVYIFTTELFTAQQRGRAMGIIMMGLSIGSSCSVPLGIVLSDWGSWRAAFGFVGLFSLITVLAAWQILPAIQHARTRGNKWAILQNLLLKKEQFNSLWVTFFLNVSHFSMVSFIPIFLFYNVHTSQYWLTLGYVTGGFLNAFTFPYIGKITDQFGAKRVLLCFSFLSMIPMLSYPALPDGSHPLLVVAVILSYFLFSSPRYVPAQTLISLSISPQDRGSFMSMNAAATSFSQGIASLLAGAIIIQQADLSIRNYDLVGYLSIFAGWTMLYFVYRLKPLTL